MADIDEETDNRFDDIDVDSILARVERRGPLTFSRKRCLYQAPEFVKRLSGEETVEEGSTVRFDCKVVGFPRPKTKWFRDDDPLEDNPRIKIEVGENGAYTLTVESVSKCDEGAYRCLAENAEGSSSSTYYVTVKAKSVCRSPKKSKSPHGSRSVSFLPLCPTIIEKITEEDLEETKYNTQPDSPLTHIYDGITLRARSWPEFLGDWAFVRKNSSKGDEDANDVSDNKGPKVPECNNNSSFGDENNLCEKTDRGKDDISESSRRSFQNSSSEPTSKQQKQKENYSSLSSEKEIDVTDIDSSNTIVQDTSLIRSSRHYNFLKTYDVFSNMNDDPVSVTSSVDNTADDQILTGNEKSENENNVYSLDCSSSSSKNVGKSAAFKNTPVCKTNTAADISTISKEHEENSTLWRTGQFIPHLSQKVNTHEKNRRIMRWSDLVFESSVWEFAFVLSAFCLFALSVDMPGHTFVFCVLAGLILYHTIRSLLDWIEDL